MPKIRLRLVIAASMLAGLLPPARSRQGYRIMGEGDGLCGYSLNKA